VYRGVELESKPYRGRGGKTAAQGCGIRQRSLPGKKYNRSSVIRGGFNESVVAVPLGHRYHATTKRIFRQNNESIRARCTRGGKKKNNIPVNSKGGAGKDMFM